MRLLSSITRGPLAPHLADQVRKLRDYELFQGETASVRGAGQGEEHASLDHAGLGPGEHGRRADLLVGQHAEQLAEAGEALLQEGLHRLEGGVAAGDAGTAREDEGLHRGCGAAGADHCGDLRGIVLYDGVAGDLVPRLGQELADEDAARVGLGRLAVRHGEDKAADRGGSVRLVLLRDGVRHARAGAQVELPAVKRACDDVALDGAVAEIAAGVRALVTDGEDLVAAAEERYVEAVHHRQLYGAVGESREVEHLHSRHSCPRSSRAGSLTCALRGATATTLACGMLPLTLPSPPPGARVS